MVNVNKNNNKKINQVTQKIISNVTKAANKNKNKNNRFANALTNKIRNNNSFFNHNPYSGPIKKLGIPKALPAKQFFANFNSDQLKYYNNLINPWEAKEARLPRMIDIYSKCAKPKTTFKLTTNATGNMLIYFDPDFVSDVTTLRTAFLYNNSVIIDGSTPATGANYSSGPISSVPIPPVGLVYKTRLVSAAIKATPKLSALNNVGTIIKCVDYGDYTPSAPLTIGTLVASTSVQAYSVFANALQGTGGCKYDLIGENVSVTSTWFPADPAQSIFIDSGGYLVDNNAREAGGSPKIVMCFEALNNGAATTIEFEIVWNIEYLAQPASQPWLGGGGQGPKALDAMLVHDHVSIDQMFPNAGGEAKRIMNDRYESWAHKRSDAFPMPSN
jgi:hypothetical protein